MNTKKIIITVIRRCRPRASPSASLQEVARGKRRRPEEGRLRQRRRSVPRRDPARFELRSLVYTVSAVGSVDAFEKVQVTARVSGVVDRVLFSEGNFARVDQILVEIEPERYSLAVEAAQASYEKAVASLADAEAGLKRRETVIDQNPGLIPGEEVETWRTKVRRGQVRRRPDEGRPQSGQAQPPRRLRPGAVLGNSPDADRSDRTVRRDRDTVLATLVRRDPLLLRFKVPEREAARLRIGMKADFRVRNSEAQFSSKIVHVAESADDTTRLVAVTAEVEDTKDEPSGPARSPRSRFR